MSHSRLGQRQLTCIVKTLKIPRNLPCSLFISYKTNASADQTPCYKANAVHRADAGPESDIFLKTLNHAFTIPYIHALHSDIKFGLHAKAPWGACLRIGEQSVHMPDSLAEGTPFETDIIVTASSGDFTVSLYFELGTFDSEISDVLGELSPTSPCIYYLDLVSIVPPSIDLDEAKTHYYSLDGGFGQHLTSMSLKVPKPEDVEQIREVVPRFEAKIQEAEFQTEVISQAAMMLMLPSIEYVTVTGEILTAERACDSEVEKYPRLTLYMIRTITECLSGQRDVILSTVERTFLNVIHLFFEVSGCTAARVSERKLASILSVSYFFVEFLDQKFAGKLITVRENFASAFQNGMTGFVERMFSLLCKDFRSPGSLVGRLDAGARWFRAFGFPPAVWKIVRAYLLERVDYTLAQQWIDDPATKDPLDFKPWAAACPDHQWPLIAGVWDIVTNVQAIKKKKRKMDSFRPELTGVWMIQILKKLKMHSNDLEKALPNKRVAPVVEDIDEWVRSTLAFRHEWKVPAAFPPDRTGTD
jgi:hypothetical protein